MSTSRSFTVGAIMAIAAITFPCLAGAAPAYDLGQEASNTEIQAWNIDVNPNGVGLPAGRGTVAEGKDVFSEHCAACHGDHGQGGPMDRLVGGQGTLASDKPVRTVGSYWPYATTLFDYVHRAMPFNAPGSLSADQLYAVSAYVLYLNGIVDKDATMNANTLPRVQMPNRNGFTRGDPRPDVRNTPCMRDCR